MPDGRGRASETRTRRANDVVAPRGGLDLVLSVDDDASDASVFEAEGKREEDVGAWDDVLEAFDAYCERGFAGDGFDVDELLSEFVIEPTAMRGGDDGDAPAVARSTAARAIKKHIAHVLRDSTSVAESDDDEREMTRREAKDVPTAIKYVRTRVNSKCRSLRATGKGYKPEMNRFAIVRDLFVAELRAFGERIRELETLVEFVRPPADMNIPEPRVLLQKEFKKTLAKILNGFDESFERLAVVARRAKSSSAASSRTATEASNDTREEQSNGGQGQGRHKRCARNVLAAWLWEHFYPTDERLKPIPTRAEKEALASQTGLTVTQVGDWFVNARARLWKPYIEGLIRGVYDDATVKKALDLQVNASAA